MEDLLDKLTDKEKDTLRLIVRGHDAKTAARDLGLSVHTINERLRSARRKLDVTSSREAARVLLEHESGTDKNLGYEGLGDVSATRTDDPVPTTHPSRRLALWIGGAFVMSIFALIIAVTMPVSAPLHGESPQTAGPEQPDAETLDGLEVIARQWLSLVDTKQWSEGHAAGATVFREFISSEDFGAMIGRTRKPLGTLVERNFESFGSMSGPTASYRIVMFNSDFTQSKNVRETVTLVRDDGVYKVSGYRIETGDKLTGNGTPVFADREREVAARVWLELVDKKDWAGSYAAAGSAFQEPNTIASWQAAAEQVHKTYGAVTSRTLIGSEYVASPEGYQVVKFRTDFEKFSGITENITLQREKGELRVIGYFLS